jgi:hypothetical protein
MHPEMVTYFDARIEFAGCALVTLNQRTATKISLLTTDLRSDDSLFSGHTSANVAEASVIGNRVPDIDNWHAI